MMFAFLINFLSIQYCGYKRDVKCLCLANSVLHLVTPYTSIGKKKPFLKSDGFVVWADVRV
jgi:hypothetical protein